MVLNFIRTKMKKALAVAGIFGVLLQFAIPAIAKANEPHFATEKRLIRGTNLTRNQQEVSNPVFGEPGDEFRGLIYIHNDELDTTAKDVTVKVSIPSETVDKKAQISARVSAENADSISDSLSVDLTGNADIFFEPGTVKLFKVDEDGNPIQIPFPHGNGDDIVTTGVRIGDIQGCFQFVKYVSFGFKTKAKEVPKQPNLHVSKLVRNVSTGEGNFVQSNQAHAGDTLEYKINFSNTGEAEAFNVLLKDVIPPHTKFVNGSAVLSINGGPEQKLFDGDNLVEEGIRLKEIEPRESSYVKFRVVIDKDTAAGTVLTNTAILDGLSSTAQTTIVAVAVPTVTPTPAKPLPVTGPIETASAIIASMIMGAYGFIRYRRYMATREVKIINDLLDK